MERESKNMTTYVTSFLKDPHWMKTWKQLNSNLFKSWWNEKRRKRRWGQKVGQRPPGLNRHWFRTDAKRGQSHPHTYFHTHTHTLSLFFSLSLTNIHTHTHTHTPSLSYTLYIFLSLAHLMFGLTCLKVSKQEVGMFICTHWGKRERKDKFSVLKIWNNFLSYLKSALAIRIEK